MFKMCPPVKNWSKSTLKYKDDKKNGKKCALRRVPPGQFENLDINLVHRAGVWDLVASLWRKIYFA